MPRFPDAHDYLNEEDPRDYGFRYLALAVLKRAVLDHDPDVDLFWFRFFPGGGTSAGAGELRRALRVAIRQGLVPAASGLRRSNPLK